MFHKKLIGVGKDMLRKVTVGVVFIITSLIFSGEISVRAKTSSYKILSNKIVTKKTYIHFKNKKSYVWNNLPKISKNAYMIHNLWNYKQTNFKAIRLAKIKGIGNYYRIQGNKWSGWINIKNVKIGKVTTKPNTIPSPAKTYTPITMTDAINNYNGHYVTKILRGGKTYNNPDELKTRIYQLKKQYQSRLVVDREREDSAKQAAIAVENYQNLITSYQDKMDSLQSEQNLSSTDYSKEIASLQRNIQKTYQEMSHQLGLTDRNDSISEAIGHDQTVIMNMQSAIDRQLWNLVFK